MPELNGILNIYKPLGCTSHDVVAKVRRVLKTKKVGHTGTLDPEAEGVLVICVGKATKLVEYMMEKEKEYVFTVKLGIVTDTQDMTGKVLHKKEVGDLSDEDIKSVLKLFCGDYMQIPPMYSALKVQGKKLYELAREGKEIERPARKVDIRDLEFIERVSQDEFIIRVDCSKGTYIRTLCHDIGEKLGCGACMKTLARIRVDEYYINECLTVSELENEELVQSKIISVEQALDGYSKVYVLDNIGEKCLYNGANIYLKNIKKSDMIEEDKFYRIYDTNENFVALYKSQEEDGQKILKIEKMF